MLHVKYQLLNTIIENLTHSCIFFYSHRLINEVVHINLNTNTFKIASKYKQIKLACSLHWHWLI